MSYTVYSTDVMDRDWAEKHMVEYPFKKEEIFYSPLPVSSPPFHTQHSPGIKDRIRNEPRRHCVVPT